MSGWIEWKGGGCPVPAHVRVDVMFDDGGTNPHHSAGDWCWAHKPDDDHIVAYRLIDGISAPDIAKVLAEALHFVPAAMAALEAYEVDYGEALPDEHELGRIDDSRGSSSFRIRVGHLRRLSAALALYREGRS